MPILIAILALAQAPSSDAQASRAKEDARIAALPHPRRLEDGLPPRQARLVRQLGDPCVRCRDVASAELEGIAQADPRPLWWGIRHRDAEIRRRCRVILDRLYACAPCEGRGYCVRWVVHPDPAKLRLCGCCGLDTYEHHEGATCVRCAGAGSTWRRADDRE